ncbi:MAG: NAD(P)/FAD-dependent oxidoreductase, partial [Thermodesulfobacteriota bacterium]|nr:NAD(P)/FAD-dependent oxidoreductase [Thermodesulfobacteriota bacterium]
MGEKFDFIVIGGGHNGLTAAAYLCKGGHKTIVLERREVVGGGVISEEVTLPGFKHNLHSVMHSWIHTGPVYRHLELEKYGSKYIFPDHGVLCNVFRDGSSIVWYKEKEKFIKEIAKFSPRDARTYERLYEHWLTVGALISGMLFNPAPKLSELIAPMEGTYEGREILWMMHTSTHEYIDSIFESPQLKAILAIMITQSGTDYDAMGTGFLVPSMMVETHGTGISVGGSGELSKAMIRVIEANGGIVKNKSEVKEILIKNGIAHGVRLSDGREITANKAVISNLGPSITFGDGKLVAEEYLDENFMFQIRRWRPGLVALLTPHFALNEPIHFKAAERNPEVDKCWITCNCENLSVMVKKQADIRKGIPSPEFGNMVVQPTKEDPTQAPSGKHTAFIYEYAPNCRVMEGGSEQWDKVKEEYADGIVNFTNDLYAPNLKKSILKRYVYAPSDIERNNPSMIGGDFNGGSMDQDQMFIFRPFHSYPPYHTPIENLYMCGPNCHPGGGCSGAPGYNAVNVIFDDFKLKKWWKPFV